MILTSTYGAQRTSDLGVTINAIELLSFLLRCNLQFDIIIFLSISAQRNVLNKPMQLENQIIFFLFPEKPTCVCVCVNECACYPRVPLPKNRFAIVNSTGLLMTFYIWNQG